MNLHCFSALAVVVLMVGPSTAYANEAEIVYYDIVGDSAQELRQQIDAKGPVGGSGKRVDGHTDWHVAWRYRYAPAEGICKVTELRITLTGRITLPRWAARDDTSRALVKKWQSYSAALRLHEDGHYSHGEKAAEEIKFLGQSFRTSDGCSKMERLFDAQAASILEKYRAADVVYDADTKHGRTQGVTFP
jgi:predicted secreted Zn-dependent protease